MTSHALPTTAGVIVAGVSARFGVKGSDAPALLQQLGLRIPPKPNSAVQWKAEEPFGSGRCLRQGNTEFLIELDSMQQPRIKGAEALPNAWILVRSDYSLVLDGAAWPRELAQICSFDFERLRDEPDLVVMTLMAGIGVTLIREPTASSTHLALRLWCDAGFSTYLLQCLHSIGGKR